MTLHTFLYALAVILFVVAGLQPAMFSKLNVRCEWLAAAALVLTYVL